MDRPSLLTDAWEHASSVYQVANSVASQMFEAAQQFTNEFNILGIPDSPHAAENEYSGASENKNVDLPGLEVAAINYSIKGRGSFDDSETLDFKKDKRDSSVVLSADPDVPPSLRKGARGYNTHPRSVAGKAFEFAVRGWMQYVRPADRKSPDRSVFQSSDISAVPQVDPEHISARNSWQLLGSGGFGKVYKAEMGQKHVAVKVMHEDLGPEKTAQFLEECKQELHSMHTLTHPAIVHLIGYLPSTDEHRIPRIVVEYMENKTMHDFIHNSSTPLPVSLDARLALLKQVAYAIRFIHTRGFVHRDVKLKNILLSNNFKVAKLGGFEMAAKCIPIMTNCVGTCPYMAPEVFKSEKYGTPADVYSFAITLWETITKERPYPYMNQQNQVVYLYEITTRELRPRALNKEEADVHLRDIVKQCWSGEPSRRMTMDEILTHLIGRDEEERETRTNDAVEAWLAGQTTPENNSDAEES